MVAALGVRPCSMLSIRSFVQKWVCEISISWTAEARPPTPKLAMLTGERKEEPSDRKLEVTSSPWMTACSTFKTPLYTVFFRH